MRILLDNTIYGTIDNTIYEVVSVHIDNHFFTFKTVGGNICRLPINNKYNPTEITNSLLRNGYVELDNPAKLETLGSQEKVKVQH